MTDQNWILNKQKSSPLKQTTDQRTLLTGRYTPSIPTKKAKKDGESGMVQENTPNATFLEEKENESPQPVETSPPAKQDSVEFNTLQTVRSLLTCAVCMEIRTRASQCSNGHLICFNCAVRILQQSSGAKATCPICRIPLKLGLKRCLLAEQLAGEIPSSCRYCSQTMPHRLIAQHEMEFCTMRPVICRFSIVGCLWNGKWSESVLHAQTCPYMKKKVIEVEDTLVENLQRTESHYLKCIKFSRQLLNELKNENFGATICGIQVAVFRDQTAVETSENVIPVHSYHGISNQFRCNGLRQIAVEVKFSETHDSLEYSLKNKTKKSMNCAFKLCYVQLGELEFDTDDQLHVVQFNDSQKKASKYRVSLSYNPDVLSKSSMECNSGYSFGIRSITVPNYSLSQNETALLHFIVLLEKRDFSVPETDDESMAQTVRLIRSLSQGSYNMQRLSNPTSVGQHDQQLTLTSTATEQAAADNHPLNLRQRLNSSTGSLLRPLLSLFFPGSTEEVHATSSSGRSNRRQRRSIVLTIDNPNAENHPETDSEEETESGASSDDEDFNLETDEEESDDGIDENVEEPEDSDIVTRGVEQVEEMDDMCNFDPSSEEYNSNNNALTDNDEPMFNPNSADLKDLVRPLPLAFSVARASSYFSTPNCSENRISTNENACVYQIEQQKIRKRCRGKQPTSSSKRTAGVKRKRSTNRRCKSMNKNENMEQHSGTRIKSRRKFTKLSKNPELVGLGSEANSNKEHAKINDSGIVNCKRLIKDIKTVSTTVQCNCKTSPWLCKLINGISKISNYLVRGHVALPLPYIINEHALQDEENIPTILAESTDDLNSHEILPLQPSKSTLRLSENLTPTVADNNAMSDCIESTHINEEVLGLPGPLKADTLPPLMRSFRADITQEIARLAQRATDKPTPHLESSAVVLASTPTFVVNRMRTQDVNLKESKLNKIKRNHHLLANINKSNSKKTGYKKMKSKTGLKCVPRRR